MRYRLALDLGTTSIGLVAYELGEDGSPVGVSYHAVRIFAEPLTPPKKGGVGQPKKAQRRLARQQRRQHHRRAHRLRQLAHLAPLLGLDPSAIPPDQGQDIHRLRSQAAHQPIALADLLNVLLKIAKRRGYSGGFRTREEDDDAGVVQSGIDKLRMEMADTGCETLGDYLNWRFSQGSTLKLKSAGLYADRALVQEEFERIWTAQSRHHPILQADDGRLKGRFQEALFQQRPLRSPAPMVGNCPLEPSLRRSPMAQPVAQTFRIEKQIADLQWTSGRRSQPLDPAQRQVIRELLGQSAQVGFNRIYRELETRGCPKPPLLWLNLESSNRNELVGDKTRAGMDRLGLLAEWSALQPGHQITIVNLLADIGSPELLKEVDWQRHLVVGDRDRVRPRELPTEVVSFIDCLAARPGFGRFANMGLDSGRSAYSLKALRTLTAAMQQHDCDEHGAMALAYPKCQTPEAGRTDALPPPRKTGNVVVDVALRQIHREVNTAIRHLGGLPAEIIVELSRDMALGLKRRGEIVDRIARNTKARRQAAQAISDSGGPPTPSAIRRYLLWTEQDHACPYCHHPINLSDALNGAATHYEHIYPRALTRIGKQRDYLVLAHRECNDAKGDRTPWQAWGQGQDLERWQAVEACAERLRRRKRLQVKARQLTAEETADTIIDDQVIRDFSARQFHESSWIAKRAASWLRTLCPDVMVGRGTLTAYLRRTWRLETVIPEVRLEEGLRLLDTDGAVIDGETFQRYRRHWEGHPAGERTDRQPDKRIDHRHHLIDALVIGLCDRRLYQRMARHYKEVTEAGETRMRLAVAPPLPAIRDLALDLVRHCHLTHKPDRHIGGNMFQATAYGQSRDGQRLLSRKPVGDLGGGPKATEAKVRAEIAKIEHASTREIIGRVFEHRLSEGKTAAEAIRSPIAHPHYGNVIRRVVLKADGLASARLLTHGKRQPGLRKLLKPEGYAFLEVVAAPSGPPRIDLVPIHLAFGRPRLPGARRFFKGDMVRDSRDGLLFQIGQIKAEDGGSLILARHVETAPVDQLKGTNGRRQVSGRQLLRLELVHDV